MKFHSLIILCVVLSIYSPAQSQLKGNARSIIITPPLEFGYTLGGYGARMSKPAEGIHDDIRAKALVINDGSKKMAIVTMDVLGFPPNIRPMICEKLFDRGWGKENVMLLPSHSHTSLEMFALNNKNVFGMPAIGIFQPELLDFVVDELARLIRETDQNLADISIGTGQMMLEGMNRNRRGDEAVDRELTVTRVDKLDGDPLAVLVNWTAHPTIMDEHDMLVSGGWPGYLQRELEDWIGNNVVAMYYNGAEGDQSVVASKGGSHYEKAEYYGRSLAQHALSVYNNILPIKNIEMKTASLEIPLPAKQAHPSFMETGGEEYQLDEYKIQALLDQIFPASTTITAVQLGDLIIIGAPGEMIAELGLEIKAEMKNAGVAFPVIGGLANEWISYMLTEDEYYQGGYETSVSFYGPTLGKIITDGMIQTAKELTEQ